AGFAETVVTWVWDGHAWANPHPAALPNRSLDPPALAYDAVAGRMILDERWAPAPARLRRGRRREDLGRAGAGRRRVHVAVDRQRMGAHPGPGRGRSGLGFGTSASADHRAGREGQHHRG